MPQAQKKPPKSPSTATAAALVSGSADVKPACYFCGQSHYSNECGVVTSIERRRILRGNGRCFVCLRKGHIVQNCRSKSRCNNCSGRHHSSLCQKVVSGTTTPPLVTTSATNQSTPTATSSQMNPAVTFGSSDMSVRECNLVCVGIELMGGGTRFLWIDENSKENPEVVTFRFTRVIFVVSSSRFLLNATV